MLVSKPPLGTKGIEGEDWEWREVGRSFEEEEKLQRIVEERGITRQAAGREVKVERCKGKMKKVSFWFGHNYWFEQQHEPVKQSTIDRFKSPAYGGGQKLSYGDVKISRINPIIENPGRKDEIIQRGANKRCVWSISTQSYHESHFATFPEALIEPMIRSGCPQFVCKKCGKVREKIYDVEYITTGDNRGKKNKERIGGGLFVGHPSYDERKLKRVSEIDLTDCGCNAGFEGGIVFDPFLGSGTVAKVAEELNRRWVGLDLGYGKLVKNRILGISGNTGLLNF
jgi:hypothetical protein